MTFNRFIRLILSVLNQIFLKLKNNKISFTTEVRGRSNIRGCKIGKYGYIGPNCNINNTQIGNYTSIAPSVQIGGMEHSIHDFSTNTWLTDNGDNKTKTIIDHDVWIAAGSIIKQGIHIGQGAVIGANSFVNRDVPPYAIVVGSPAKIIRFRFHSELISILLESKYYDLSPSIAKQELYRIKLKYKY